ncbi:hypothetical protein JIQ42_00066 [Leishmania sp. Namibia]|uniref:hypothetical protein n=1 Tax=Leishmania sp. Namibia TaxID=2802991 RepID=UPI001B4AADD8|nr:hypothetical protein JIQ42_00066 [Leishmania sp. Namibia]
MLYLLEAPSREHSLTTSSHQFLSQLKQAHRGVSLSPRVSRSFPATYPSTPPLFSLTQRTKNPCEGTSVHDYPIVQVLPSLTLLSTSSASPFQFDNTTVALRDKCSAAPSRPSTGVTMASAMSSTLTSRPRRFTWRRRIRRAPSTPGFLLPTTSR